MAVRPTQLRQSCCSPSGPSTAEDGNQWSPKKARHQGVHTPLCCKRTAVPMCPCRQLGLALEVFKQDMRKADLLSTAVLMLQAANKLLQKPYAGLLASSSHRLMLTAHVNLCPADSLGSLWRVHEGTCGAGQP